MHTTRGLLDNWLTTYLTQNIQAVTKNNAKVQFLLQLSTDNNLVKLLLVMPYAVDKKAFIADLLKYLQDKLTISDELAVADKESMNNILNNLVIEIDYKISAHKVQGKLQPIAKIKNIIAVASGKGGVGKSLVAASIAFSLAKSGVKVGLLDADIYGPSQPHIWAVKQKATISAAKKFEPLFKHGVKIMSVGNLVDEDTPTIWRGPIASGVLQQLLNDTAWDELDYLVVDLPPGTGDVQLTLAQKVPISGAVVVTTPQDLALLDVKKAVAMFNKLDIPILGVVENMSTHTCSNCGQEEAIFGDGAAAKLLEQYKLPLLAKLPLAKEIREWVDRGEIAKIYANQEKFHIFLELGNTVASNLAARPKNYSSSIQKLVLEE